MNPLLHFQMSAPAVLPSPSDECRHLLPWEAILDLSQSLPFLPPATPPQFVYCGTKLCVLSPSLSLHCESTLIHVGPHGGLCTGDLVNFCNIRNGRQVNASG